MFNEHCIIISVLVERLDNRVALDHKDLRDLLDPRDHVERVVSLENVESLDLLDHKDREVPQDPVDQVVNLDNLDLREKLEDLDLKVPTTCYYKNYNYIHYQAPCVSVIADSSEVLHEPSNNCI